MPFDAGVDDQGTVGDVMRWDLSNYMVGDILTKIDRASMAHGLELRAPFLDLDLATFCISLPDHLKIADDMDKVVMRLCPRVACVRSHSWEARVRSTGRGMARPAGVSGTHRRVPH